MIVICSIFSTVSISINLTICKEKSVFRGTKLRFLGHIISGGTIAPDPQRSAPFIHFPVPTTLKQLHRFIGLAVYHAKWIPHFSKMMDPLFSALTTNQMPLSHSAILAILAIQKIKQHIKDAVLWVVDPSKELVLTTDASGTAIGGILSQNDQPVAFMSKRLNKAQQRWSAAELEGYAVVEACNQFRHYLGNRPFKIFCDQHGFVQALSPKKGPKRIKNRKFARWRVELADFDFSIHHLPGELNKAADALSRISSITVPNLVQRCHEHFGHPGIHRLMKVVQEYDNYDSNNLLEICSAVVKKLSDLC